MAKNSLYCEETDTKIYVNDIVTISSYPNVKWLVKNGWYTIGSAQKKGWYFRAIKDETILSLDVVKLEEVSRFDDNKAEASRDYLDAPLEGNLQEVNPGFLYIQETDTKIYPNDAIRIVPDISHLYIAKYGSYMFQDTSCYGWYFISTESRAITPLSRIDLGKVIKDDVAPPNVYQDMDAAQPEMKYVVIPGTDIRLYDSDIIKISNREGKWIIHSGWYVFQGVQNFGWYFESIKDGEILPVSLIDMQLCTLATAKTQGSELYDGRVTNYTRPFTPADAEVLNRTFITVETNAQRDNLDKSKLVNGRMVRVNNVGGVTIYYAWNANTQTWDKVDFGGGSGEGIPEIIGTLSTPIVLSELEPGLYRVKGVYEISPTYGVTENTSIDHIVFVNESDEEEIQIKVITEDKIKDYIVDRVNVIFVNEYATHKYVDDQIDALEAVISEIISELPEVIDARILEIVNPIPNSFIYNLFNP